MTDPFTGRTALVTGAASGIGRALSDELARLFDVVSRSVARRVERQLLTPAR